MKGGTEGTRTQRGQAVSLAKCFSKHVSLGIENDLPECTGLTQKGEGIERLAVADPGCEEAWGAVTGHCCCPIPITLGNRTECRLAELGGIGQAGQVKELG